MKVWALQSEQKVLPFLEFLTRRCQLKVTQPSKGILYTSLPCSGHASSAIQHQPAELLIISPDSPAQFLHLAGLKLAPKTPELTSQTSVNTNKCLPLQALARGNKRSAVLEGREQHGRVTFVSLPDFISTANENK